MSRRDRQRGKRRAAARKRNRQRMDKVYGGRPTPVMPGRTFQTNDSFLESANSPIGQVYRKPGKKTTERYRRVVAIEGNDHCELAVVKLTSEKRDQSGKPLTRPLPDYRNGKSHYRPFVETKDVRQRPLTRGNPLLTENPPKYDVAVKDVERMRKDARKTKSARQQLAKLHQRDQKSTDD